MFLVVADTSPVRYLVQIGLIDLLGALFDRVLLPSVVADELSHPSAPSTVQSWMKQLPEWATITPASETNDPLPATLDAGERSAIALGISLKAPLILMDDRRGAMAAVNKGFTITGTLGVLDLAAERRMIDFEGCLGTA
jgi:predicted nucleic acid-binding protein